MIIPVILSGGSGLRLWPLSRETYPKFLLTIFNEMSLLQNTMKRIKSIKNAGEPIIVCSAQQHGIISEQLEELKIHNATIITEPEARDTLPAILTATILANNEYNNPQLLVLPSDQIIDDHNFAAIIDRLSNQTDKTQLYTFGISPKSADTTFGYIKKGNSIVKDAIYEVEEFIEKPNKASTTEFVNSGEYLWNCGIFLFNTEALINESAHLEPRILQCCEEAISKAQINRNIVELQQNAYQHCPTISIDYAIMERTDKASVIPLDIHWSDIGNWNSLWEVSKKNSSHNVEIGNVKSADSSNCYLSSENNLLVTIGLHDHIVLQTTDATLVAHKDCSAQLKKTLQDLKKQKVLEVTEHSVTHSTWGKTELINKSASSRIKRVTINKASTLTLNSNTDSSHNFTVVSGEAHIILPTKAFTLFPGDTLVHNQGIEQTIQNMSDANLQLIEVEYICHQKICT